MPPAGVRTAVAAAALLAAAAGSAQAQPAKGFRVAVIDIQRVFSEAKAARKVGAEMDVVRREFGDRVREQEQRLREAAKKLRGQQNILAPAEFARRQRELQEEGQKAQASVRERKRELDLAFRRTRDLIMKHLVAETRGLLRSRNIDIVLEKNVVFLAVATLDLTPELIERLDARLPTVELQLGAGRPGGVPGEGSGGVPGGVPGGGSGGGPGEGGR